MFTNKKTVERPGEECNVLLEETRISLICEILIKEKKTREIKYNFVVLKKKSKFQLTTFTNSLTEERVSCNSSFSLLTSEVFSIMLAIWAFFSIKRSLNFSARPYCTIQKLNTLHKIKYQVPLIWTKQIDQVQWLLHSSKRQR